MKANLIELKPRLVAKTNQRVGIISNGADNAYPSRMERLILASSTAKAAAEMYANFLTGGGFVDEALNGVIVGEHNYKPITLYKLLERTALSVAFQSGFFWAVGYKYEADAAHRVNSLRPLPFKACRLGEPDDASYSGKIAVFDNWDGTKGKKMSKDIKKLDIFNPRGAVVEAQMVAAGAPQKYRGQIFHHFNNDEYTYPLSPLDVAQDDADTEHQISLFKNGELRGGMFAKYLIRHAYFETEKNKTEFLNRLREFQSAENNGAIMLIEDDIGVDETGEVTDNGFKMEKVEQNIDDKLFINWEKSTANNIRKAFKAIPTVLIEYVEGKLGGTSGEALTRISEAFAEVLEHWGGDEFRDESGELLNFDIKELEF